MKIFRHLYIYFFLTTITFTVCAQGYNKELTIQSDNDVYIAFRKDRYYTNGTMVNFRQALSDTRTGKNILELELGQKIYTPYYGKAPDPALHDRPFSGYLYGGAYYNRFPNIQSYMRIGAELGGTGKYALGDGIQKQYHQLIGIYKIAGWEYQLNGEISLNLNAAYARSLWKSANNKFDLHVGATGNLGNAYSNIQTYGILRFGRFNSIDQSALYHSRISHGGQSPEKEFYLFVKPQLNWVAYDASIQGPLFNSDKGPVHFGIKHWVFSPAVGLSFASQRWTANYIVQFKTKEVQSNASGYHYGSLSLGYKFN